MSAWNIFYSYAHEDHELRAKLATYIAPLKQQKKVVEWYDRQIKPGGDWDQQISDKLDAAHLILLHSYARLYERTRQRMRASSERTQRMDAVFVRMREIATASYPLLSELATTPSPGERLAAISILQVFASEKYLEFLVELVGSEKPFVGYNAILALRYAVEALEPRFYPLLAKALKDARSALDRASVSMDSDRLKLLEGAEEKLKQAMASLVQ